MSDIMRPIPFSQLMNWIIEEHKTQDAIFGVRKMVTTNQEGALPIFDERIETPFGPAAGPNTQLAQNIVASYVAGSRFFELKTVQVMDGEELSRTAKALKRLLDSCQRLIVSHIFNGQHDAIGNAAGVICLQVDWEGECSAGKLCIGGDGILQVPKQKLKIGAIGNADIRNGLQRFWYIAARGRLHAISFPARFRLGYTV